MHIHMYKITGIRLKVRSMIFLMVCQCSISCRTFSLLRVNVNVQNRYAKLPDSDAPSSDRG